ncbi:MAG TPA: GNAT family N-acetyltransferase [Longimicrobium sp.]|nr:GNAT family N-acetyltransferase [Longimicrobium sp.]
MNFHTEPRMSHFAPPPFPSIQPTLQTVRLILRPMTETDAPAVQLLASDREVAHTTLNIPHPYPEGAAAAWIRTQASAFAHGDLAVFGIELQQGGELVGTCGLRLEAGHSRAEIGYWIGREYWGRGVATEAAHAVVEYAFAHLRLRRVYAHHYSRNPASGTVLTKVGMRHEGRMREHILKWGVHEDIELYGILHHEFTTGAILASTPALR